MRPVRPRSTDSIPRGSPVVFIDSHFRFAGRSRRIFDVTVVVLFYPFQSALSLYVTQSKTDIEVTQLKR